MRVRQNIPIAVKTANLIRRRLRSQLPEGGRLPGEIPLASELGVSRGTIRQALAILEREGIIFRRQGQGTFANPHVLHIKARIETASKFTELIEAAGFVAAINTTDIRESTADGDMAQRLGVRAGAPIITTCKILYASGQPAIYDEISLCRELIREPFVMDDLKQSMFDFIEKFCQSEVVYLVSEIIPTIADGEIAARLGVPPGQPLLRSDEVYYDPRNKPLGVGVVYFRDPIIRFHALRKVVRLV